MNASSRVGGAREADGYRQVIVGFRRSPQGPDAETTARLPHNQGEMEMTAATFILTLVGTCVAIRALWVWRNTLENQRVDECLAAVYDVVGLANRCLSLKEKGVRYDRIWQAYWEAWNSQ